MRRKSATRDPGGAYRRKVAAARRVGIGARCACGEDRPEALIAGSKPMICAACERAAKGRSTTDDHHSFGRANNPATIRVPVNDHRADLSIAQAECQNQLCGIRREARSWPVPHVCVAS